MQTCYCTRPAASTTVARSGTVTPDTTLPGDCGTGTFEIHNLGRGNAQMVWGFNSSLGPAIYRNLEVNWVREKLGNSGGWTDAQPMFGAGYRNQKNVSTGTGTVTGDLSGSVTLVWGARSAPC